MHEGAGWNCKLGLCLILIQLLNHPAGFHGHRNIAWGSISSAVKTVTKDRNRGRFFSVTCPAKATWRGGGLPAGRGALCCKAGGSSSPLFGPGYLKELPCCVHCAVGSCKVYSPPFLLPEPQQANADSGPVPLQVRSGRLLKDAKRCHVY